MTRKTPRPNRWLGVVVLAVICTGPVGVVYAREPDPDLTPVRECAANYCTPSIPGPVTDWPWSDSTHYLRQTTANVSLRSLDGSVVWIVQLNSATQLSDLVAEGDFTGDGVPDFIFGETRPSSPVQYCAGHAMSETQLVFVDGAAGTAWRPIPATLDLCWPNLGYATHQWGIGTAYIGHFQPGRPANDVVLFPYYSTFGWVLTFSAKNGWRRAQGDLAYPSTPAFDGVYNGANVHSCSALPGQNKCYVENSHVPNAVFVGTGGSASGLLVLTSSRAVIYRPDLTPTSDLVWTFPEGSGRNYGLVESHDVGSGQMVTVIGGCSVAKTRDSMRLAELSDDPCGLERHYEYFFIQGQSIVQHDSRYFSYAPGAEIWQDRLEFPFPSSIPVTGGALWSVFNFYHDGQWRTELLPNPADPAAAIEVPGWYVWGSVTDRAGQVLLVATRTAATPSTSLESYLPPWEFDFLRWRNGGLISVAHHVGVVPSLVLFPPGPSYHVSDGDTFGLVEKELTNNRPDVLLVETLEGRQSYVSVPDSRRDLF